MKRFLIFLFYPYQTIGGIEEYKGSADNSADVIDIIRNFLDKENDADLYMNGIDTLTGSLIETYQVYEIDYCDVDNKRIEPDVVEWINDYINKLLETN